MAQQIILVVEDNLLNLESLGAVLPGEGNEVLRATDAVSALDAVGPCRPDLILLDIQIPRMDGQELARRLKADPATQHIPLVAVTACAMMEEKEKIMAAGFDA